MKIVSKANFNLVLVSVKSKNIFSLTQKVLLIIQLLGIVFTSKAQLTNTVYEDFNQFFCNPYLINPTAVDSNYKFKLVFNNLNELRVMRNVKRFYVDGDVKISSQNNNHFIGIQTTNSKLGDYISRSRFQVRYSMQNKLSDRARLSLGISIGFVNYAFLTTQGGTGGSDFGPDGTAGLRYLRRSFAIGVSSQQIFSTVLVPVYQSFKLNRVYNIDASKDFFISPRLTCKLQSVLQTDFQAKYVYNLSVLAVISENGLLGINSYVFRKTSFNAGLQNINLFGSEFSLIATYSYNHSQIALPDNTLEIFLGIKK